MHLGRRIRRALGAGIIVVLVLSAPAWAGVVNEFSAGIKTATNLDGLLGRQNIRTDPAHVTGVGFVHPTQMDIGLPSGDFVAVGTYKGAGTTGGASNCSSDYDALWSIYRDGMLNGVYYCYTVAQDVYSSGANPSFEILRTSCGGSSQWVVSFDGIQRGCFMSSAAYASAVVVGP